MGSTITTVGNRRGKPLVTLAAPSYNTGVILSTSPVTNIVTAAFVPGDLPMGYKNVWFQLLVGDMTVGGVTVLTTLDQQTMLGVAQNWEPVVAPSSEAAFQWANPLTSQAGQRLLKADIAGIAYAATTSDDFDGTTTQLLVLAAP